MLQQVRCHNCSKPLGYCFDEEYAKEQNYPLWHDKLLSFNLKISHHATCCKECKHVNTWDHNISFCSTECLHSAFASGKIQEYIDKFVFWKPLTDPDPYLEKDMEEDARNNSQKT